MPGRPMSGVDLPLLALTLVLTLRLVLTTSSTASLAASASTTPATLTPTSTATILAIRHRSYLLKGRVKSLVQHRWTWQTDCT